MRRNEQRKSCLFELGSETAGIQRWIEGCIKLHARWRGAFREGVMKHQSTELEGKRTQTFGQHPTEIKEETCLVKGCRSKFRDHLILGSCGPGHQNDWAEDTQLETEIQFLKEGKPLPRTEVGS